MTLDRPIQIASGTRTHANDSTQVITAAQAAADDCGITLAGLALSHVTGKEFYGIVRFVTGLKNFGSVSVSKDTAADPGAGVIAQVQDLEWFLRGNEGEIYRMGEPTIHAFSADTDASVAGSGYDFLDMTFEQSDVVGFQANVSPIQVSLVVPATAPNYAIAGTADDITDVLEVIAGTGIVASGGLAIS